MSNSDLIVGKYNIFNDPDIIATGRIYALKRAFRGEIVFFGCQGAAGRKRLVSSGSISSNQSPISSFDFLVHSPLL